MAEARAGVSVALCTYNGARYLEEQLRSIAGQSLPPLELVACDDRSTDETVEILRAFAASAPFPVRVHVNERNLGSTRNFEQAIGMCRGGVIALCDQDDVWPAEKLARMEAVFRARPGVGMVFTDGVVVDDDLRSTGLGLWQSFGFTPRMVRQFARGDAFLLLLARNLVTGAAMAFRASVAERALPVPELSGRIHDGWIALVAAAGGEVTALNEPLLLYRRHAAQQLGPGTGEEWMPPLGERVRRARGGARETYLRDIRALEAVRACLLQRWPGFAATPAARTLEAKLRNLRTRATLPDSVVKRVPRVARELATLRYHRFAEGMWSAAKDLVLGS